MWLNFKERKIFDKNGLLISEKNKFPNNKAYADIVQKTNVHWLS